MAHGRHHITILMRVIARRTIIIRITSCRVEQRFPDENPIMMAYFIFVPIKFLCTRPLAQIYFYGDIFVRFCPSTDFSTVQAGLANILSVGLILNGLNPGNFLFLLYSTPISPRYFRSNHFHLWPIIGGAHDLNWIEEFCIFVLTFCHNLNILHHCEGATLCFEI